MRDPFCAKISMCNVRYEQTAMFFQPTPKKGVKNLTHIVYKACTHNVPSSQCAYPLSNRVLAL